jgi:hypothetical protein
MAAGWLRHLAGDGIDISAEHPKPWTDEVLAACPDDGLPQDR